MYQEHEKAKKEFAQPHAQQEELKLKIIQIEDKNKLLQQQSQLEQKYFTDFLDKLNELDDENKKMKIQLE